MQNILQISVVGAQRTKPWKVKIGTIKLKKKPANNMLIKIKIWVSIKIELPNSSLWFCLCSIFWISTLLPTENLIIHICLIRALNWIANDKKRGRTTDGEIGPVADQIHEAYADLEGGGSRGSGSPLEFAKLNIADITGNEKISYFSYLCTTTVINPQNNNQITSIQVCVMGFFLT